MTAYESLQQHLKSETQNWFIAGVAGFNDGDPLEVSRKLHQQVGRLKNFSSRHRRNLNEVKNWSDFALCGCPVGFGNGV